MADKRLIPDGIRDVSTEAFNDLIDRLGTLDLTPLLVYIISNVNASALPHLAEQFHVSGNEGWALATTNAEKRALIKRAIELHRYKGTPWAVKEAIKAVGYADAEIVERLPSVKHDGLYTYSGTEDYMGGLRWALFRVLLDIGESKSLARADIEKLVALINEYKNVRSHLKDVSFRITLSDDVDVSDIEELIAAVSYVDVTPWGRRYDGSINHSQADRRLYNSSFSHNSQANYSGWLVTGEGHNNSWDTLDMALECEFEDKVAVDPRYDGNLKHSGFTYGSDSPFAVDAAMPLIITKHIRHDGKYDHGGIYHNNAFGYSGSKFYFGGISYRGNIQTMEAVI